MLREDVLTGRTIALADASAELHERLVALGAALDDGGVPATLVADARPAFAAAGGGYDGVRAGVDGAFAAVRETAVTHWIPAEKEAGGGGEPAAANGPIAGPGGQVVVIAPAPGAGRHAGAARSGLENLVRTLSTEWARHRITTVAVLPGDATSEVALAHLVAWLCSPAGAYLSGTALTLDRGLQSVASS